MTQLTQTLNNYSLKPLNRILSAVVNFFKVLHNSLDYSRRVNETIKELSRLTDKELKDIGISRGDIYSVAVGDETLKKGLVK